MQPKAAVVRLTEHATPIPPRHTTPSPSVVDSSSNWQRKRPGQTAMQTGVQPENLTGFTQNESKELTNNDLLPVSGQNASWINDVKNCADNQKGKYY